LHKFTGHFHEKPSATFGAKIGCAFTQSGADRMTFTRCNAQRNVNMTASKLSRFGPVNQLRRFPEKKTA